ncbi:glycoside hydrolase family 26 protein [Bdellovibrio sp. HCB-110]|uniref:glycoside hydrolase family 26 protein n=1 Tax=Bdellovibrio sp. HCB-110 TaxID=3391182 RepID=UPI0039B4EFAF
MKLLFFSLLLVALQATATEESAAPLKVLPPAQEGQLYHGAFTDNGEVENQVSVDNIKKFENLSGKDVAWVYFSNHWFGGNVIYPADNINAIKKSGAIPYIRMSPWSRQEEEVADPLISMQKVIDGVYDADLKQWAREASKAGTAIMIEFGPEANGSWFPWNGIWNGGSKRNAYGDPNWPDGPERFRDAYRHVVDLFKKEGANNITWILHIDTSQYPNSEWNDPKYYYPGDNYIDWIGITVYGQQIPTDDDWEEFVPKLTRYMPKINAISTTKPLMISEYAVIEDPSNSKRKAKWISDALNFIMSKKIPRIYAATYWHAGGWLPNEKNNFKIDSSANSLKAYKDAISDSRWISRVNLSK